MMGFYQPRSHHANINTTDQPRGRSRRHRARRRRLCLRHILGRHRGRRRRCRRLSFILLILGVGLGLSAVSPYQYNATALGSASVAWIAFTQLAAAGIGGYMAGRLRVKWAAVHGDEVYFRDTAHGLLTWAVATLVTVAVLAGGARRVERRH
jgi:hypothetical protein